MGRELSYVLAWRIHSCCIGRVIWTITQDTPLRPSSTTFDHNSSTAWIIRKASGNLTSSIRTGIKIFRERPSSASVRTQRDSTEFLDQMTTTHLDASRASSMRLSKVLPGSYCQELCMEAHAASCSTRSPSLKATPCMTSGRYCAARNRCYRLAAL